MAGGYSRAGSGGWRQLGSGQSWARRVEEGAPGQKGSTGGKRQWWWPAANWVGTRAQVTRRGAGSVSPGQVPT